MEATEPTLEALMDAHKTNMLRLGQCRSRYQELIERVEAREQ